MSAPVLGEKAPFALVPLVIFCEGSPPPGPRCLLCGGAVAITGHTAERLAQGTTDGCVCIPCFRRHEAQPRS